MTPTSASFSLYVVATDTESTMASTATPLSRSCSAERDTELVEHGPKLGVDLVEAGQLRLRLWGRVVDDVLVVDRPVVDVLPVRLLQREPVPVGTQTPFEQPVRLALLGRDQPDDVLAQTLRNRVGVQIGRETVPILLAGERPDLLRNAGHARRPTTRQLPTPRTGNPDDVAPPTTSPASLTQANDTRPQADSVVPPSTLLGLLVVATTPIAISLPCHYPASAPAGSANSVHDISTSSSFRY